MKDDDYKFEQLERKLYHAMKKVNILQKKHRKLTGQNFVPNGPLPKPDVSPMYNPCKNNQGCFLPREN